jgi:outer membrane protein OmpA-like peptidoglycan-associated protein
MTRLLLIFVLAGCTALPNADPPALVEARASVAAAQADAEVAARAPAELQAARDSLARAERAQGDPAELAHRAYLAAQRSRIARELAQARRHDAEIAVAGEEKYRAAAAEAALARARAAQEAQSLSGRELARELERLQAGLRFESGRAALKPLGRRALENVARILRQDPERSLVIEGFTDDRGSEQANRVLSERRARAVRAALVAAGVPEERLVARGLGESYPVASNASPAGRQLNRRVEILIGEHAGRAATGSSAPSPR